MLMLMPVTNFLVLSYLRIGTLAVFNMSFYS